MVNFFHQAPSHQYAISEKPNQASSIQYHLPNAPSIPNLPTLKKMMRGGAKGYVTKSSPCEELMQAILHPEKTKSFKLLQLIPGQFTVSKSRENLYNDILSIVDFVSGMTDLYAIDIYRKITGINIPIVVISFIQFSFVSN